MTTKASTGNEHVSVDAIDVDDLNIAITLQNLEECLRSVTHWTDELPRYASREQGKADRFAITAGVLAAVTGASIYPVAQSDGPAWLSLVLALPALVAAICAVFPNVRNYSEMAGRARELTTSYGPLKGVFMDAVEGYPTLSQDEAHKLMKKFHQVKGKKDQLQRVPTR
ncbi:hypothetical protein ACFVDI_04885 [Nocardioides sp. NPDC057767]|jgi:hypothetical protein|uniref:hypothetical protein n=1 Tax=unclassified Nocardioides TaxID=2615069 RepID=UPI00331BAA15